MQDQDIHRTTAAAVYGIPIEEVTYNQRRFAKAVNFGLIYGMGPYRLARDSELTLAEAENYIKAYFARFPGIRRYLDETVQTGANPGLCGDVVWPSALLPGLPVVGGLQQSPGHGPRRTRGREPSHPGHGGRHHQGGHDPPAQGAECALSGTAGAAGA